MQKAAMGGGNKVGVAELNTKLVLMLQVPWCPAAFEAP
jgi:hypothetical protein